MGLSFSLLVSHAKQLVTPELYGLTGKSGVVTVRSVSFDTKNNGETMVREVSFKKRDSNSENADDFNACDEVVIQESRQIDRIDRKKLKLETTVSFKSPVLDGAEAEGQVDKFKYQSNPITSLPEHEFFFSPRPVNELDAAAVKVQKVYKSYRTRRNLADCAVVVEELWWKALDFAALEKSSVSFFKKPETAVSRWARARTRAAKVGKGLSKDEKAQKLALRHWLEAIDPRHRYGHNLHMYYAVWFASESFQPFFYWLDVGDGKEVNLENCPRTVLQHQCIKYLGPKEREAYQVIVEGGKLIYKQNREFVDTTEDSKWIFVLSTSRNMYVAEKKKGLFQHSSFLAGGATTASGRLVAHNGVLEAIWPYSGHYCPTEENFMEFITFLQDHQVDLTNVKRCSVDDDQPPSKTKPEFAKVYPVNTQIINNNKIDTNLSIKKNFSLSHVHVDRNMNNVFEPGKCTPRNWSTGAGARTGCVRDYPTDLQFQALEQVNLLPRMPSASVSGCNVPIPSPRPIPNVHLSPKLAHMGLPSPRLVLHPGSC